MLVSSSIRDVTERRRLELALHEQHAALERVERDRSLDLERIHSADALRSAEERMRFALEAAGVGVWDLDAASGAARWSEILEAQWGMQPGTFGGTFEAFLEHIHPDDRAAAQEAIEKAMISGNEFAIEYRAMWPDGTTRWLRNDGRILRNEHGEPIRGVGISQDITESKRLAAELQHLNDEIQLQRLRVFKATMRTVQDIVNNLLNGLQLVQLDAEGQQRVEMRMLVDQTIQEAAVKLKTLGDLETVTERELDVGLGIDYPGADPLRHLK